MDRGQGQPVHGPDRVFALRAAAHGRDPLISLSEWPFGRREKAWSRAIPTALPQRGRLSRRLMNHGPVVTSVELRCDNVTLSMPGFDCGLPCPAASLNFLEASSSVRSPGGTCAVFLGHSAARAPSGTVGRSPPR
jgi:hypothetical protein